MRRKRYTSLSRASSALFYRHPFFTAHGYHVRKPITVVAGTNPGKDPVGHGTGESANLFAAAPGAILQPIRASDTSGNLVGAFVAFLKAKELHPQIITNSWGGDGDYPPTNGPDEYELAFALEVQHAIEDGIFVVFSPATGNFRSNRKSPGFSPPAGCT